jgi:Ca2+-binding RTX toxin-like protein
MKRKISQTVLEGLEGRRMLAGHGHGHVLAATPTMDSTGIVHVEGTGKRDVIVFGVNDDHSKMLVTINKKVTEFTLADVKGIDCDGKGGSDSIKVLSGGVISGPVTLHGGSGNDDLVGSKGDDLLDGGGGNDKISGGDGNDTVTGGKGNDRMDGGMGNDNMEGAAGNDKMDGGAGNDVMSGGAGNDRMVGGDGDDQVSGDKGNDDVNGGMGTDDVIGGGGHDRFHKEDGSLEHKDQNEEHGDTDDVTEVKPT